MGVSYWSATAILPSPEAEVEPGSSRCAGISSDGAEAEQGAGVPWKWAGSHLCDVGKVGFSEQLCPPLSRGGDNTSS